MHVAILGMFIPRLVTSLIQMLATPPPRTILWFLWCCCDKFYVIEQRFAASRCSMDLEVARIRDFAAATKMFCDARVRSMRGKRGARKAVQFANCVVGSVEIWNV